MTGLGTVINVFTILGGGTVGLLVGGKLPERTGEIAMQAVGGVTLVLGLQMALGVQDGPQMMVVLISLVLGSVLGEWWDLEGRMNRLGQNLEARFARSNEAQSTQAAGVGESRFVRGFMAASLLFLVGPMAVLGALQDGLQGDATILIMKSTLDGIASVALAAALGPGVLLSIMPIMVYQGGITVLAGTLGTLLTTSVIDAVTVCGGIMIIGIAVNMWKLGNIRVGNMAPALVVSGLITGFGAALKLW
ncbi:MAG TPA: DUF554 domain-containing protein [Firmicutes bacterium]|nr:DUF554 domain-containing protein [Bacillota bacterium]